MITFKKFTMDGVQVQTGIPISSIIELSPNNIEPKNTWVKYHDGYAPRSMVVVGSVADIVMDIRDIKRWYNS